MPLLGQAGGKRTNIQPKLGTNSAHAYLTGSSGIERAARHQIYALPAATLRRALSLIQKDVGWCLMRAGSGNCPAANLLVLFMVKPVACADPVRRWGISAIWIVAFTGMALNVVDVVVAVAK